MTSIAERYTRATQSSDLEMIADQTGAIDVLTASGWIDEGLGTLLYRLRAEWDALREEHRRAEESLRCQQLSRKHAAGKDAAALHQEMEHAALSLRLSIITRLRSLPSTRDALGRFADDLATRRRYMRPYDVVAKIAGRTLELWLDPQCPVCTGRASLGVLGGPQTICPACKGTGKRPYNLHETVAGHDFGRMLMDEMDRKTKFVGDRLIAYLDKHGRPPKATEALLAGLRAELDRLRSVEAQED